MSSFTSSASRSQVFAWLLVFLTALPNPAAAQRLEQEGSITRFKADDSQTTAPARPAGKDMPAGGPTAGPTAPKPAVTPTRPDTKTCAVAYHGSLKRIEAAEFVAVEAARQLSLEGDPRLPGMFLVPPRAGTRSKAEMSALAAANAMARSRGWPSISTDPDSRWIANRLRVDLADYLGQGPSPFLCGGVPAYVETLRRFADRIGTSPQRNAELRKTQQAAAERSVATALAVMKPVSPPRFAPADRPNQVPDEMMTGGIDGLRPAGDIDGLRPAAGIARGEPATAAPAAILGPPAPVGADPDLPPLKPRQGPKLADVTDAAAAVDALLVAAKTGGFITEPLNQMAIGGHAGLPPLGYPVLSRIAKARQYVSGPRPLVEDQSARIVLASALADIEALDYLMRAERQPGDPTGTAIHATLDAILKAHAKDCACGG